MLQHTLEKLLLSVKGIDATLQQIKKDDMNTRPFGRVFFSIMIIIGFLAHVSIRIILDHNYLKTIQGGIFMSIAKGTFNIEFMHSRKELERAYKHNYRYEGYYARDVDKERSKYKKTYKAIMASEQ